MRVRILRDKRTGRGRVFRAGSTHDLAAGDANVLIRRGIAEPLEETPVAARRPAIKRVRRVEMANVESQMSKE